MGTASQWNGATGAESVLRSGADLLAPESSLAASSGQAGFGGDGTGWLESLPMMAFLERGEETSAANDLARRFIGTGESVKTNQLLRGAYPVRGEKHRQRFECLLCPPNGVSTTVFGAVQPFAAGGKGVRLVLLMEPLEDSAGSVADAWSESKATFLEDLFNSAPEAMAIVQQDRILRVNREFVRLFGYSAEICLGSSLLDLVVPEGRYHETEMLVHMVEAEGRAAMETVRRTSAGEDLDVSIVVTRVRLGAGRVGHSVTYRDIRQEKQMQAQLHHTALHDPLTGLANRVLFLDRLTLTMARLQRRPDRNFAVIFLDLDRFKQVNDSWGHAAGDTLLLAVTARLLACLRPQDTVARFGGDEFVLLLDEAGSTQDIVCLVRRIQIELQRPVDIGEGGEACVSASMGIALGSPLYNDVEDILRDADVAMYRAKSNGRARHEFFAPPASEALSQAISAAIRSVSEAA